MATFKVTFVDNGQLSALSTPKIVFNGYFS
jgi:hypothetical protein